MNELKSGDLCIPLSDKYRDYRDQLKSWDEMKKALDILTDVLLRMSFVTLKLLHQLNCCVHIPCFDLPVGPDAETEYQRALEFLTAWQISICHCRLRACPIAWSPPRLLVASR